MRYIDLDRVIIEKGVEFKQGDHVMVEHPDFPELNKVATVTKALPKIVDINIQGSGNYLAHIEFLRHATEEEIRAASKS